MPEPIPALYEHLRVYLRANPGARAISIGDETTPEIPPHVREAVIVKVREAHPLAAIVEVDGHVRLHLDGPPPPVLGEGAPVSAPTVPSER